MDRVYVIRDKVLREGRSIRSVARELGISRVTVRKYLRLSAPKRVESQLCAYKSAFPLPDEF